MLYRAPRSALECSGFGNLLVRIRIARRALSSVIPNAQECSPTIASPGALPRFSGPRRVFGGLGGSWCKKDS
ncbi:hypothetical protein AG1IA_04716 [Rhizoctonia solani AG-1 IA]|uniref:Uncharacterized protein n=1 Tax=Thanatephorus cucumeris (strain AG1-IA) TaxID=983506 RepID=L8WT20_THACA|nr:hypothetical protein AG1IA_04716 [Rhizoctonia solani AG-1 IA]